MRKSGAGNVACVDTAPSDYLGLDSGMASLSYRASLAGGIDHDVFPIEHCDCVQRMFGPCLISKF